jgi:hypothetical protein
MLADSPEKASKQESGLDTGRSARYGLGVALSLSSAMEDTAVPDVVTGVLPTRGSGVPSYGQPTACDHGSGRYGVA